ncbi:hypothetical protein [Mycolicibacterium vaccae]|uniref:hypothetical protein n=1 Tax=Mycolicibacterium vaccae TaxID=1810 RepID=UPI003CF75CF7
MAGHGDLVSPMVTGNGAVDDAAGQRPVAVRSCSRLGRVANPPGFSLSSWLRRRR